MWWGIWCFDKNKAGGCWLEEFDVVINPAILAFRSKRKAMRRAADTFGYVTYTEAKRAGRCEVRPLVAEEKKRKLKRKK